MPAYGETIRQEGGHSLQGKRAGGEIERCLPSTHCSGTGLWPEGVSRQHGLCCAYGYVDVGQNGRPRGPQMLV